MKELLKKRAHPIIGSVVQVTMAQAAGVFEGLNEYAKVRLILHAADSDKLIS